MTHSLLYRVMPSGALRELRLRYDMLEWLFDGYVVNRQFRRRPCDFHNAARSIKDSGAIVVR